MAEFANMDTMDVWYARLTEQDIMAGLRTFASATGKTKKEAKKARRPPGGRSQGPHARQPAGSVETGGDGRRSIPDHQSAADRDPPSRPPRDRRVLARPASPGDPRTVPRLPSHTSGRPTPSAGALRDHRCRPQGRRRRQRRNTGVHRLAPRPDQRDPLFLQVKEATASVLEDHLPKSRFNNLASVLSKVSA